MTSLLFKRIIKSHNAQIGSENRPVQSSHAVHGPLGDIFVFSDADALIFLMASRIMEPGKLSALFMHLHFLAFKFI